MAVFIGLVIVVGAVLLGFTMAGGHLAALVHPSEIVTIGGAALGALIVMSPKKVLGDLVRALGQGVKGSPYQKPAYMALFQTLYALARAVRANGLLALDSHISKPHESPIFQQNPAVGKNHHVTTFLCDSLGLIVDAKVEPANLNSWLQEEIEVIKREHHAAIAALSKTADALPGFGIVAAVLGIVVTMQAIGGPPEEIGHKVGAALVGTFLGILLSYGFFAPMAGRMEFLGEQEVTYFQAIAAAVVSMAEGANPKDVILRACRSVGTDCRPNREELAAIFNDGDKA